MFEKLVIGVDEAGRGPLAGDVFAGAVLLGSPEIVGLTDSKKLSPKKREELEVLIKGASVSYFVACSTVEEIDSLNILNATLLAMNRAIDGVLGALPPKYQSSQIKVIIDGNQIPNPLKREGIFDYQGFKIEVKSQIKGDLLTPTVSAASILAKTARDRHILQSHESVPQYKFNENKGYGTALHLEMIRKYGPSIFHRKSFNPVKSLIQGNLF